MLFFVLESDCRPCSDEK